MRRNNLLGALVVGTVVVAGGSAFTSTNTVSPGAAGDGTTTIATYSTSNVQYTANTTNPQDLDAVTFTLDKAARYVAIRTHTSGTPGQWFRSNDGRLGGTDSCTSADPAFKVWTCDVTGATPAETVLAADDLTVVATT